MEKLSEKMAKNDYREKVPVKVQEQDAEKVGKNRFSGIFPQCKCKILVRKKNVSISLQLRQSQTELENVKEAMDNFRKMM